MAAKGMAIDGDTFDASFPIWHTLTSFERVRVLGVNTPERKGATKTEATIAKGFTQDWLNRGPFLVETCKRDSFGRVLGKVFRGDSVLADELIKNGLGVKFP